MTRTWTRSLLFDVSLVVDEDLDRIDVYCPGTGLAERHRFGRGSVGINQRLDPFALVARAWFAEHPPKKVWKVGDVVPKDTILGVAWTAAPIRRRGEAHASIPQDHGISQDYGVLPMNVDPQRACREDREILWIEP